MKKFIFAIIGFLLFTNFTVASSNEIEFEEFTLANGMHVILHEDHSTPLVAVTILYHVGSKNEDPKRTGFAHFFEHLMFEGSKNIARGEYDKIVETAGGALNANTNFDRTFYYEILPSNQLELGLWLESERLLHLNVDTIGVETQRKVVKEERKQRLENQPYGSLAEEIFKRSFKVHPYNWMPIGSAQYIDQATIDEFMDFYKTYYVPQNATLSIAGDLDIDETKELVEKYFGSIPKGTREIYRPNVVEPPMTSETRDSVFENVQLPAVIHAYHIPAQGTDDYYAINMLTTILSQGQSSRMYKELVDNQQVALQAASIPFSLEDSGLFIVFALPNIGKTAEELESAFQEEIDKIKEELITEKEFQKLQNQIENNFVTKNARIAGIAETLADYHVYFGDANLINTEIERYMKVTREDIKRVANKYLDPNKRVVLYYLPKSLQN